MRYIPRLFYDQFMAMRPRLPGLAVEMARSRLAESVCSEWRYRGPHRDTPAAGAGVNATAQKFGDPATRIARCGVWTVLLRPRQPTLGSLVLVCEEPVAAFGQVSSTGYADLAQTTRRVESMLGAAFAHDKINYLMLMMVDPDVHFHVLPRYATPRQFAGQTFADPAWPSAPDLGLDLALDAATQAALIVHLRGAWQ